MCGIAGVVRRDGRATVDAAIVRAMVASLRHRGPDGEGYYEAPGVSLGMCRLSIIDLVSGDQPLFDESGDIAVMQNGEIYNYRELRAELVERGHRLRTRSDTEVIAHLYEDDGEAFPERLNGMFATALFDRRLRRLVLARDRAGEKPLFLYEDREQLLFASEIKALLVSGLVSTALDPAAIDAYLAFNFVPGPRTAFRGIRQLAPATTLTLDAGASRERRYWRVSPGEGQDDPASFRELFESSVALRLRADVPVGIYLSGGVDSSATAWAAARAARRPVRAFHVSFPGEPEDESLSATAVARGLGVPLDLVRGDPGMLDDLPLAMWHADQPHGDASFLPMLHLARRARDHVKVVLSGEGADETLGGYTWHAAAPYATGDPWPLVRQRFERNAVFTSDERARLLIAPLQGGDPAELVRATLREVADADTITQTLYVDFALLLPGNNLVKADRMGMACGVEIRCPFLDHRLVELAFSLPGPSKVADGVGKLPLRRALADVLPGGAAERPKRLFAVPVGAWLRGPGAPLLDRLIHDPSPALATLLRSDAVAALVAEHRAGTDRTRKVRALVALDAWTRRFARYL